MTEIEAMAKVIGDKAVELARGKWEIEWPWLRDPDSNAAVDLRELARAALTAAAHVRERARPKLEIRDDGKNPLITVGPDDVFVWLRSLADAAGYRDRETCAVQINTKQNFVGGQNFHWEVPMLTLMVSNIPNSRREPTEPVSVLGGEE